MLIEPKAPLVQPGQISNGSCLFVCLSVTEFSDIGVRPVYRYYVGVVGDVVPGDLCVMRPAPMFGDAR